MKILMITSKFPRFVGDTQPGFVYNFAEAIHKLGHEVVVVAPHDANAEKKDIINGIPVYRFQYFWPAKLQKVSYGPGIPANVQGSFLTKLQFPFFALFELLLAKRVAKKFNPDVIHAHWALPQGLAAKATRKPYFVTVYGGDVFMSKRFHLTWLLGRIIRKSRKTFVITRGLEQVMREFGVKPEVSILPVGIDTEAFYPNYPGSKEIRKKFGKFVFFIGRHVEKKGIRYLIEAFSEVVKEVRDTKLIIGGEGPLTNELKQLAQQLNLADKVVFAGSISVEDLPKYYAAAELFVAPSIIDRIGDRETQGVVLLEAMASKTAVIGTNTGGIPDVISSKEVGILVPEKDSQSLAKEITKLLSNPELRNSYALAGYKHVHKNFTWDVIAKKYEEEYKKVLLSTENKKNSENDKKGCLNFKLILTLLVLLFYLFLWGLPWASDNYQKNLYSYNTKGTTLSYEVDVTSEGFMARNATNKLFIIPSDGSINGSIEWNFSFKLDKRMSKDVVIKITLQECSITQNPFDKDYYPCDVYYSNIHVDNLINITNTSFSIGKNYLPQTNVTINHTRKHVIKYTFHNLSPDDYDINVGFTYSPVFLNNYKIDLGPFEIKELYFSFNREKYLCEDCFNLPIDLDITPTGLIPAKERYLYKKVSTPRQKLSFEFFPKSREAIVSYSQWQALLIGLVAGSILFLLQELLKIISNIWNFFFN